jgi:excisionase family DNA binding protein
MDKQILKGPEALPMLLTVKQACTELQVGRTQLYGICKAGSIRVVKIGERGVRIPRDEIARYIRERMEG